VEIITGHLWVVEVEASRWKWSDLRRSWRCWGLWDWQRAKSSDDLRKCSRDCSRLWRLQMKRVEEVRLKFWHLRGLWNFSGEVVISGVLVGDELA
jgi:hypothetical protein